MKTHSRSFIEAVTQNLGVFSPDKGAEIGVWRGENSEELLKAFPRVYLYMVDCYLALDDESAKIHRRTGKLTQVEMDKVWREALDRTAFADDRRQMLVMDSREASGFVLDGDLDFVFIDASHDYDSVTRDIELWDPKVKEGGIIGGHDYNGKGDRRGRFGVKRAVDEKYGDKVNVSPGLVWWVKKSTK